MSALPNQNQGLSVVSLFDGMSCGRVALDRCGIIVNQYFASEIEKAPIAVSQSNWSDITHVGDVTQWSDWQLKSFPTVDLLIGGSPCQDFSMAGKRAGMATESKEEVTTLERYLELKNQGFEFTGQSYLFWEYVQILKQLKNRNPDILFMLENVKMSPKWENVISQALNVEPVKINAALVSAQNRVRLYWTNIKFDRAIKDRGIVLADILDLELPSDLIHSDRAVAYMDKIKSNGICKWDWGYHSDTNNEKSSCIVANFSKGQPNNVLIDRRENVKIYQVPRGNNSGGILNTKGKCPTITSNSFEQNCFVAVSKEKSSQRLNYLEWENDHGKKHQQQRAHFSDTQKSGTVPACKRGDKLSLVVGETIENYIIRRFTVAECEKLQGLTPGYCAAVAKSHAYKMIGNGWQVDVIEQIFNGIKNPSTKAVNQPRKPEIQFNLLEVSA